MENFNWITGAVFPYINFLMFCFLAFKLFSKQVRTATAKKHEDYLKLIEQATAAKKAAEQEQQRLDQRLNGLGNEISKLKEKAKIDAEKEANLIVLEAQRFAEHVKNEAKRVIENEVNEARSVLKNEIVTSVKIKVVEQIEKELTPERQLEVARLKLNKLEQTGLGAN